MTGAGEGGPRADLEAEQLHDLLTAFYEIVEQDELLASYFAVVDMAAHMPVIVDFWSTMLFHTGRYTRNAFRPHLSMPGLTAAHFARWLSTLEATVDARYVGDNAERMKELAGRIAYSMQLRLGIPPFAPYSGDPAARARRSDAVPEVTGRCIGTSDCGFAINGRACLRAPW